jgi:exopolysaccharide production protein ExoY
MEEAQAERLEADQGLEILAEPIAVDGAIIPLGFAPATSGSRRHGVTIRAAKRLVDIVGSIVLIVLLLPLAFAISLAIAIDSRGPITFRHRRVGRDGEPFDIVKFRTMVSDGDATLARALAQDDELRREWRETRKLRRDPRITRVGRFLRRTSLDELPQLVNVLVGTMSLVGPRPVMADELAYFGERAHAVLSVRPGLTGLWAVSGRSNVSYDERVELEYRYATGWTLGGDVAILLRTLPAVVRGHGAY